MEHKSFAVIAPVAVAAILILGNLAGISSTAAAQLSKTVKTPYVSKTVKTPYVSKTVKMTFTAKLTGSNATFAPVNTPATGIARFELSSDGKVLNYDLSTTNLKGFKKAYICDKQHVTYEGKTGETCAAAVELLMGKGKITSYDLFGPMEDGQISDVVKLIKSGEAYVEVDTQQHQNGEILGQIRSG
jgi:hypothetical protein